MQYNNDDGLTILLALLLPGTTSGWPAANLALDGRNVIEGMSKSEIDYIFDLAADLAGLPPTLREERIADRETSDGPAFQRMLATLYRLYYTSPPVLAVVAALAEAGPREPSPHVDPTLVAQVLAHRAGQRRLGP
jgi:hypothetical protein